MLDPIEEAMSRIRLNEAQVLNLNSDTARWRKYLDDTAELTKSPPIIQEPYVEAAILPHGQSGRSFIPDSSSDAVPDADACTATISNNQIPSESGDAPPHANKGGDHVTDEELTQDTTHDDGDPNEGRTRAEAEDIGRAVEPGPTQSSDLSKPSERLVPEQAGTGTSVPADTKPRALNDRIVEGIKANLGLPVKLIAEKIGIKQATARYYVSELQIEVPSMQEYKTAKLKAEAGSKQVKKTSPKVSIQSLAARVRRSHIQHPNWTARMIANELGAKVPSVANYLTQARKGNDAAPKGEPQTEAEILERAKAVSKRLGKA